MFYIYYCPNCDCEKEFCHRMTEEPSYECPNCKNKMKKKITGGIGVIYNGVGWASKGTATAPKPKRIKQKELAIPIQFKDAVRFR